MTYFYYYVKFDANYDNVIRSSADPDVPPEEAVRTEVIVWTKDDRGQIVQSW